MEDDLQEWRRKMPKHVQETGANMRMTRGQWAYIGLRAGWIRSAAKLDEGGPDAEDIFGRVDTGKTRSGTVPPATFLAGRFELPAWVRMTVKDRRLLHAVDHIANETMDTLTHWREGKPVDDMVEQPDFARERELMALAIEKSIWHNLLVLCENGDTDLVSCRHIPPDIGDDLDPGSEDEDWVHTVTDSIIGEISDHLIRTIRSIRGDGGGTGAR